MIEIPDLPRGFTPEYLTELFKQESLLPTDSRVAGVDKQQVGDGTGMMSEVARLVLDYEGDGDGTPKSFIAKYASQNETNRGIALQYKLYERETRYVSELDRLTSARTPKAYVCDLQGDRFLILMEDMTDYQVGSQVEGADLVQSEIAIDELAKLHASFWNRVDHLDWVPHIANSYHANNMHQLGIMGFDGVIEKFANCVPGEVRTIKEDFLAAVPNLQARMDSAPVTLAHGDFRMENLLYGCQPGHDPVSVIDWQGPLRARGMNDVALFLGQSTTTEVRRAHERDLLARYVRGLAEEGVPDISLDAAWEDYRHTVLYNWLYAIVVAGTLDASNDKAYAWMSEMLRRQVAAMRDLEVLPLLEEHLP